MKANSNLFANNKTQTYLQRMTALLKIKTYIPSFTMDYF